jgi:hypothetical protein
LGFTVAYFITKNAKYEGLLAGLGTGLIVAVVQYLLEWNEHSEIEAIKKLGIIRILPHRDDKAYYKPLLEKAEREIIVLGNTAFRFFEDFAHPTRRDSQALLEALARGVTVRILLPQAQQLKEGDRQNAATVKSRMVEIASKYQNFEYRYFDHPPANSLVKIDDECLFGPIFTHVNSKDSPTIHASVNSALVAQYIQHIENEWTKASKT